jgi:hypothetical protein
MMAALQAANVVATLKAARKSAKKAKRKASEGGISEQPAEVVGVNPLEVEKADLINEYSKVLELVLPPSKRPPFISSSLQYRPVTFQRLLDI